MIPRFDSLVPTLGSLTQADSIVERAVASTRNHPLGQTGPPENKVLHAAEQDRPDVATRRAEFRLAQAGLDLQRLVFLDKTWVKTNMTRLRRRVRRGERLIAKVPHGHWKTTTFLAARRSSGLTAPDGPINGEVFLASVRDHLAPTLTEGDLVVMDNLAAHKVAGVREAVGARVLHLPPYSPDLNPLALVFSKFQWLVRSENERTVDGLWHLCSQLLDHFTPTESQNDFRHCGYRYTDPFRDAL